ncbi:MAG: arginine repressor [Gammaproteobacteria bacterium]|nr:arginine repressor [Gammaproteobacteria bacterium]
MPAQVEHQVRRREAIATIIASQTVTRQAELVALLQAAGIEATQSSVSRDLRDMGVIKHKTGYALPQASTAADADFDSVAGFVRALRAAGPNLTIVTTAVGAAQRVALSLDRSGWPEIAGTLSGDDTIFVATADRARQKLLLARLNAVFGIRPTP